MRKLAEAAEAELCGANAPPRATTQYLIFVAPSVNTASAG